MPRFKKPLYSLRKPKYRPSWNKYNLYNLNRVFDNNAPNMTYFQRKWYAKSATRAYHATTMRETDWRRIFRPDMRSVVAMDAHNLGNYDGSEYSAGRGSGREQAIQRPIKVPYMNMIYHQLERRLDTAVWRALFASSAAQARQFCLHGFVKVNGKSMRFPGYLLNPGDLFQVEVEKVKLATGDRKNYWESRFGRQDRKRGYAKVRTRKEAAREVENSNDAEETQQELHDESAEPVAKVEDVEAEESAPENQPKLQLQDLLAQAKAVLNDPRTEDEKAARKHSLRDFTRLIKKELGQKASWNTPIKEQIALLAAKLDLSLEAPPSVQSGTAADSTEQAGAKPQRQPRPLTQTLKTQEERILQEALQKYRENPVDYTLPYKTPWAPRPYMSPFAFIPRYLEVHPIICSAVYLRHPVARNKYAEVPTPFNERTNGLAFNWYLRRR